MPVHDWSRVESGIFLDPGTYVPAPLEDTYVATWEKCPAILKDDVLNSGSEQTS